jgi:hypothetical protein
MSAIKLGRNKTKKEGTMNTMSKTKINLGGGYEKRTNVLYRSCFVDFKFYT